MTVINKLVVLKLDGYCEHTGVRVFVEIGLEGQPPIAYAQGALPANPDLLRLLTHWRTSYQKLGKSNRTIKPQKILYGGSIKSLITECREAAEDLKTVFNDWLYTSPFQPINLKLREELKRHEIIQIIIQTGEETLQRLPWHLWDFVGTYSSTEIILGSSNATAPAQTNSPKSRRRIRILAVLGHSANINVEADRKLLNNLPGAEVCFLAQPERADVSAQLWDKQWDILFFAGHSETRDAKGCIYLNPTDSLTIGELRHSLRKSIENGLQLAIFNSCDGLGLVHELEQLNLPQMIVMREPIPDWVAQNFLKGFLQALSQGESLYTSVREARERLEGVENDFPCASWLPISYRNLAIPPLNWEKTWSQGYKKFIVLKDIIRPLSVGLIVAVIIILLRTLGLMQTLELKAFDYLIHIRPEITEIEDRVLVVSVDESAIVDQQKRGIKGQGSLSDTALLSLLDHMGSLPRTIGLDIYHDYNFSLAVKDYIQKHQNFYAVCRIGYQKMDRSEEDATEIAPPENLEKSKLGFSNFPLDPDKVIRRQFLGKSKGETCQTDQSFSLRIALDYLSTEMGESFVVDKEENEFKIQNVVFKRIRKDSGGYNFPSRKEATGYQILIQHRKRELEKVDYLRLMSRHETELKDLVKDKVVIIGVDDGKSDLHRSSYDSDKSTPGVELHGHMIDGIISTVMEPDKITPFRWWPELIENVWIIFWSLLSAVLIHIFKYKRLKLIALLCCLASIYACGYYAIIDNIWIPLVPVLLSSVCSSLIVYYLDKIYFRNTSM
ncbi:CHASE2 domain-containing protein [Leptolyngbyaceae cyanobacterium CCMR0082]|uniref:CHASE2 domain-containing protein n=1 Tax=Adonisia turfae CCMR0082 TaxID=2304604 RepID=A0A6M0S854_9CYAN|nr:CHASE2 domain-containing protein [Adonisia turfae]NEZ64657.1 CHASE2 domain-containing protein [Adonisia turfae CCMR0082]